MLGFLRYILLVGLVGCSWMLSGQVISGQYEQRSLASVLEDIAHRYHLTFAYDSHALSAIRGNWQLEDASPEEALNTLLDQLPWQWKKQGDTWLIYPKASDPESTPGHAMEAPEFIYGEIRDSKTHELLPFALVITRQGLFATTADADGKFAIPRSNLSDTLVIQYVGYARKKMALPPSWTEDHYLRLYLNPSESFLPMVHIEGEKKQLIGLATTPGSLVLNPQAIEGLSTTGETDIYRAIQLMPGVAGTLENSNGLFIRGANSDQTLITFDGFTLYQQDHLLGAFSALNAAAVKSVRLQKGVMDARYGGRIAGVLEVVGNEGNNRKPHAHAILSPLSVSLTLDSPLDSAGKTTALVVARRSFTRTLYSPTYRNIFNTLYNASLTTSDHSLQLGKQGEPQAYFQDIHFKLSHRANERDVVQVSFQTAKDKLLMQYADTSGNETINLRDYTYTDETTKRNIGTGVRWVHRWHNNHESLITAGISKFTGDYYSVDSIFQVAFGDTSILQFAENAELMDLNLRAEINRIYSHHHVQYGIQYNYTTTFNRINQLHERTELHQKIGLTALYLQDQWTPTARWTIKPGFRLHYYPPLQRLYPEPRLAASYTLVPQVLSLKAALGSMNQFIHRIREQNLYLNTPDYWQFAGIDELPVLNTRQVTAGMNYRIKHLQVDVEFFHHASTGQTLRLNHFTVADSTASATALWLGNGTQDGLELLARYDHGSMHAWLSYTWMQTHNQWQTDQGVKNYRAPHFRQHEAKLYLQYEPGRWSASLLWMIASGLPYTPYLGSYTYTLPNGATGTYPVMAQTNTGNLPAYHRLDLSVAYAFPVNRYSGKIQASALNVYNRKNLRDIQYLVERPATNDQNYTVRERPIRMLPFLPSLQIEFQF